MRGQKWTAERTAHPDAKNDRWAIVFDPTPGGRDNGDGTRSFSLRFPALLLSDLVGSPEEAATDIARALNEHCPTALARAERAEAERDRMRDACATALDALEASLFTNAEHVRAMDSLIVAISNREDTP